MIEILLVEDEEEVASLVRRSLTSLGYGVTGSVSSGEAAFAEVAAHRPDLVLLDINIEGDRDGIDVATVMREKHDVPVIFLTGRGDDETIGRAKRVEPYAYLFKPFRERELICAIEMALIRRRCETRLVERERELQQQVAISDRLASLGTLAAGIAHEINTPTQYIGDSIRFLETTFEDLRQLVAVYREAVPALLVAAPAETTWAERIAAAEETADLDFADAEVPPAFRRAFDGIDRIARIVRAVKQLGHPGATDKQPTALGDLVNNALIVAHSEYREVADVETAFADLPPVICHPGEISQVILNLVVNAAHAIAEAARAGERGRIRVGLEEDNGHATITVSDNGTGIPEAVRTRIFDPFFTTKAVGKGTGQGLAIARSIVAERHGGSLTFTTEAGRGTTFFVRLPLR